jgi:hypothetical protein
MTLAGVVCLWIAARREAAKLGGLFAHAVQSASAPNPPARDAK